MTGDVLGREQELGSVYAFLDRPVEAPAGFVFEGEPGIGKSTLWLAAVTGARERGFHVLSARPAEAERGFAHVGLGDLFEGVLEDVLPALSIPRRRALEVALLLEETSDDPVDHRALAVAVHDVLQLPQRTGADPDRSRRRPVARPVLVERARVRIETDSHIWPQHPG